MSYLWSFHSFPTQAFGRVFGGAQPAEVEDFVGFLQSEFCGLDRFPGAPALARNVLSTGLSYDGLDAASARIVDEIVGVAFSPEGFEQVLQLDHLSPDGLHSSVVSELLARAKAGAPPTLLPILQKGRRYGQRESSPCEYCILAEGEVPLLLDEVRRAMAASLPWSDSWVPEVVQECLEGPVAAAASQKRALFGRLC